MVTFSPTDWPGLLPVLILAGGGSLIFCAGAFWRRLPRELLFVMALLSAVAAGVAALWVTPGHPTSEGMLDLSGYARFFTCLFAGITAITILFLRQYARARGFGGDELFGLLLFAALGMVLVAGALNWVIFFLGLELLSLALYVLIAVRKGEASNEAGLKYFIMSAVASAFLTFGIALLYAMSGSLQVGTSLAAALSYPEQLPVILLSLFWKRLNTAGIVSGLMVGAAVTIGLVMVSPNMTYPKKIAADAQKIIVTLEKMQATGAALTGKELQTLAKARTDYARNKDGSSLLGLDAPLFPLKNPAIVSVPFGFMITFIVTLLFGSRRNEEMFDELFIRQNTGLGIAKADVH